MRKERRNMAKFNVEISDELAKQFKIKVIEKYGSLRGNIDRCVEEAIKLWCERGGNNGD